MRSPLLAACFLFACSGEAPPPPPVITPQVVPKKKVDTGTPAPPNRAPKIQSITFTPEAPKTHESVRVKVEAADPDQDAVDVDYLWYVNGEKQITRTRDNLPFKDFKKGDTLLVEVSASDGDKTTVQRSEEIVVDNSAPEFTTDPRSVRKIDGMELRAKDPDDDPIAFSLQGAPEGMTIHPTAGKLTYKGSENEKGGTYKISVIASDGDGGTAEWSFQIDVAPGSAAAKAAKEAAEAAAAAEEAEGRR